MKKTLLTLLTIGIVCSLIAATDFTSAVQNSAQNAGKFLASCCGKRASTQPVAMDDDQTIEARSINHREMMQDMDQMGAKMDEMKQSMNSMMQKNRDFINRNSQIRMQMDQMQAQMRSMSRTYDQMQSSYDE